MRIDELSTLLTTVASPRVAPVLTAWRAGQIIEAVVTRVSNVGTATLNVNNIPIDVRTALPLEIGARLLLEVAQAGTQVALRLAPPPPPTRQETIATAVRTLAPRQGALQPVLEQLVRWIDADAPPLPPPSLKAPLSAATPFTLPLPPSPPRGMPQPSLSAVPLATALPERIPPPALPLPQPLRELMQRVVERIATPQQVTTPDGLKQAIKNSGAFFEHKLASPAAQPESLPAVDRDLKAVLLQLVSALKPAIPTVNSHAPEKPAVPTTPGAPPAPGHAPRVPPAALLESEAQLQVLAKDTDAAVARVTLQQILSLPSNNTDAPQWIFDVPVRWGEYVNVFHLHVFCEKHPRDPKHPPAWCVRLSFNLVTLGEVGVLVTLLAGAVSVSIWAPQSSTAQLFERHLTELQAQLVQSGVPVTRVSCECAVAPFSQDTPLAQKQRRLIDEHA